MKKPPSLGEAGTDAQIPARKESSKLHFWEHRRWNLTGKVSTSLERGTTISSWCKAEEEIPGP